MIHGNQMNSAEYLENVSIIWVFDRFAIYAIINENKGKTDKCKRGIKQLDILLFT